MSADLNEQDMQPELLRQAEALLQDWYEWTRQWRPPLGIRTSSPYGYVDQEDTTACDDSDEVLIRARMEAIDSCINSLPPDMERAIGLEMRRRSDPDGEKTPPQTTPAYRRAVMAIVPKMTRRCLLLRTAGHIAPGRARRWLRPARAFAGEAACRKATGELTEEKNALQS